MKSRYTYYKSVRAPRGNYTYYFRYDNTKSDFNGWNYKNNTTHKWETWGLGGNLVRSIYEVVEITDKKELFMIAL